MEAFRFYPPSRAWRGVGAKPAARSGVATAKKSAPPRTLRRLTLSMAKDFLLITLTRRREGKPVALSETVKSPRRSQSEGRQNERKDTVHWLMLETQWRSSSVFMAAARRANIRFRLENLALDQAGVSRSR